MTKPENIKLIVAIKDLRESRLNPHMPCPLVQPEPIRVPKPTKSPATINVPKDADMFDWGKGEKNSYTKLELTRPTMKSPLQRRWLLALLSISTSPPRMPLMPAIFPLNTTNKADAKPISIPPKSEAPGVKFCQWMMRCILSR